MKSLITAMLVGLLIPCAAFSQGIVRGVITDSTSNDELVGANVLVKGTALGAATDIYGKYRLTHVPAGRQTLRVTYIGYKTRELAFVADEDGETIVNLRLEPDVIEGEEVIVTAQMRGQQAAINQQINANTIVNVISEEKIKELPDVNAAEAIGRLPGVSLIRSGGEASKVILRGMSDKFTSFTIDGVRIPPTDADARGVDLSTFSQGTLAGVELFKALTPDKDADAIAGSINLVTRKAPAERQVRVDLKGAYNQLNKTFSQYDFNGRYGERFFDNILGVQVTGNIERRDRSDERFNLSIENLASNNLGKGWKYTDFTLNYNDEIRKRGGVGVLLDINTPDSGSLRINNLYSRTDRNYVNYTRNYPIGGDAVFYSARDREQEINTLNSSVRGENYLLDLRIDWGFSYAQSKGDFPYDYEMLFSEPSIPDSSGMRPHPASIENGPPESFIQYAYNNFLKSKLDTAYFRSQMNTDREKTAFIDFKKEYTLGDLVSGELKLGGKYRHKNRFKETGETMAPYYLNYYQHFTRNADGNIVRKNFDGTRFGPSPQLVGDQLVLFTNFLDLTPAQRSLYDKYNLNPMLNRDALRDWYALNKNGISENGRQSEYNQNPEASADYYDIIERVAAGYVMNTFNLGPIASLLVGVRVESENNDYLAKYVSTPLGGFPTTGVLLDTTGTFKETSWLPNIQLTARPTDFMNLRLVAYRAIARPDFNSRLEKMVARKTNPRNILVIGNPRLKNAKAWNFEASTSFFGNDIGLITVSAFYREIKDMFHTISDIRADYRPDSVRSVLDTLGIKWRPSFLPGEAFSLTYSVNSSQPTKVWGFELEHQASLSFLPGFLSNIVLGYNISVIRSETFILTTRPETLKVQILPPPFPPTEKYRAVLVERKGKLEGQPDLFGNVSLGYDIGGFSGRVSVFFQSEYARSYSASSVSTDPIVQSFSKWDLTLKQRLTDNISVFLNLNNFTTVLEDINRRNSVDAWETLGSSQKYGLTGDIGVRIEL
ncbi:MAG: TonB-dependent receptor [Ignavibacteriae bacterium]|nr:TonB-dependent receptor [Ignavibacteriota bacterium]